MDRYRLAIIVFDTDGWRFAPGKFKHCFAWVRFEGAWIRYEVVRGNVEIDMVYDLSEESMTRWHEAEGYEVITVSIGNKGSNLYMLNTCVGHIKNLLGIVNPFIITPQQLYNYLQKGSKHGRIL